MKPSDSHKQATFVIPKNPFQEVALLMSRVLFVSSLSLP